MSLSLPLSAEIAELIAERFRIMGEPMRIRILCRLREGEASVQELTETLGTSQQNISKHLGVLHRAGMVGRRRDGNFVRYAVVDASVFDLCEHVCGRIETQTAHLRELLEGAAG